MADTVTRLRRWLARKIDPPTWTTAELTADGSAMIPCRDDAWSRVPPEDVVYATPAGRRFIRTGEDRHPNPGEWYLSPESRGPVPHQASDRVCGCEYTHPILVEL